MITIAEAHANQSLQTDPEPVEGPLSSTVRFLKTMQNVLKTFILLLGFLSFAIPTNAEGELEHYVAELAKVKMVAGSRVGYAGSPSKYYELYQRIFNIGSKEDFKKMLNDKNPIIRCMGITCLVQDKETHHLIKRLENDNTKVSFLPYGCIVSEITVGIFAREMLKDPNFFNSPDAPMEFRMDET